MPEENASCEAGPGTSIRKCFKTTIRFPGSINFQTDEYCRQLHLEIRERNKEERFASSARPGSTWTPPPLPWKIFVPARLAPARTKKVHSEGSGRRTRSPVGRFYIFQYSICIWLTKYIYEYNTNCSINQRSVITFVRQFLARVWRRKIYIFISQKKYI